MSIKQIFRKYWRDLIIIGLLIILLIIVSRPYNSTLPIQTELKTLEKKIDSLSIENVTLIQKNDSIEVQIIEVKKNYEETTAAIIANDVSDDYSFFTNYLARYNDQYYTDTVKND